MNLSRGEKAGIAGIAHQKMRRSGKFSRIVAFCEQNTFAVAIFLTLFVVFLKTERMNPVKLNL